MQIQHGEDEGEAGKLAHSKGPQSRIFHKVGSTGERKYGNSEIWVSQG